MHLISTNLLPILGLLFRLYSAFSLQLFLTVLKQISLRMTWLKSKGFGVMSSSPMMKPLLNVHVLLFRFFRRAFGSIPKSNSKLRRMITDYLNISYGINSYINSRSHRSAPWKVFLPNLVSIVRAILRTRQLYPNQRVVMWKCNMAGWYCLMLLDPSKFPFFANMWQNQVFIDPALLSSNWGTALAAQQFTWVIV